MEKKIHIGALLRALALDALVTEQEARELMIGYGSRNVIEEKLHPLEWLATQQIKSSIPPYKVMSLEPLTEWFAKQVKLPYFRIEPLKTDVDAVTEAVSQGYALRHNMLPVVVEEHQITFATIEPFLTEWVSELEKILSKKIRLVIANPTDVKRYQREFFNLSHSIQKAKESTALEKNSNINNVEALIQLGKIDKLDANDQHIVGIVDWLLQYAFEQKASDIHIEPRRENGNIRFRIDGVLHHVYEMPTRILVAVTSRIKGLGRMDVANKRRPQDGRVKTKTPNGDEIELRLSTMPTAFGEKLVMRIFDPQVLVNSFLQLGFSEVEEKKWHEMTAKTHGIILVTGPTGSGKTTTLYSTLKELATSEVNVCSIEDPIEMVDPSFNQMQVHTKIGVTFASGVRTLLRQDPDIMMIGEIRDLETAEVAIQAALTGHLVVSTLHTNDAPSAITRLLDLGVPAYLINATLIGVLAQRLTRTLCPHCKQPIDENKDVWDALVYPRKVAMPQKSQRAVGCDECRKTGYIGRIGLYEMLNMSPLIRQQIKLEPSPEAIRLIAVKEGMQPLRLSGARKVMMGMTTIEEVIRVTPGLEN